MFETMVISKPISKADQEAILLAQGSQQEKWLP
jgi:hypothetical protein